MRLFGAGRIKVKPHYAEVRIAPEPFDEVEATEKIAMIRSEVEQWVQEFFGDDFFLRRIGVGHDETRKPPALQNAERAIIAVVYCRVASVEGATLRSHHENGRKGVAALARKAATVYSAPQVRVTVFVALDDDKAWQVSMAASRRI